MMRAVGVLVPTLISECRMEQMNFRSRSGLWQVAIKIGITFIADFDAVRGISINDDIL